MGYHGGSLVVGEDGTVRHVFNQEHVVEAPVEAPAPVEPDVELSDEVDEPPKPLKSQTNAELRDQAKTLGVRADIADNMNKADLVEAIERLTASDND